MAKLIITPGLRGSIDNHTGGILDKIVLTSKKNSILFLIFNTNRLIHFM